MAEEIRDDVSLPEPNEPEQPVVEPDTDEPDHEEGDEKLSERVQKRINQLTKKRRDAERELQDRENTISALRKHNEELYNLLKGKDEQGVTYKENASSYQEQLKELRRQRKEALTVLDADKVDLIEERMEEIKEKIWEAKHAPTKKEEEKPVTADQIIIQQWVADTPWFDPSSDEYDPAMAGAAREYDNLLRGKSEWQNKTLSSRLKEVKKYVEKRFAGSFVKPPSVESGGTPPPKSDRVVLTGEQRTIARKMFSHLPSEDAEKIYAEQIKLMRG